MRFLTLATLSLALSAGLRAQQHFPTDPDLQLMLRYLVEDRETPGIALGIVEADGSTRILVAGTAGAGAQPLGPQSVFEIGSINKTFTGILLALAVERGEAALDDPVQRFLPEGVTVPSRNDRAITLLDLATHTSGLPRLPDNHTPADPQNPYADFTVEGLYAFLNGHTLRRDPGAEAEYSNLAFGLLGHALARAAGTSYVDLVRQRILEPLDMTMTGYDLEGDMAAWTTKGHRAGEVVPYWYATEAIHGAGGLRSTMADMLTYLQANLNPPDNALGRAIRTAQQRQRWLDQDDGESIGLGWQRATSGDRTLVMHGGGTGGYSTRITFDPERGIGMVLLTNTNGFGDDLDLDFLRRGAPLPVADVTLPRATLAGRVGEYQLGSGGVLHVRLEDDSGLTFQAPNNVRFRLYADNDSVFVARRAPWRVTFSGDSIAFDIGGQVRRGALVDRESPPPAEVAGNAVRDILLSADEVQRYAGSFALDLGGRTLAIRIFPEGRGLAAQPDGQGPSMLRYQGNHTFVVAADPDIRLVFTVEGDRATTLTLHQAGRAMTGSRVAPHE